MVIPVCLLIISGPVGVGKTSTGNEVSGLLNSHKMAHSKVDLDALAETYPRPAGDRFGTRIALLNLRDIWTNCSASGSRNLIIPRVIETEEDVRKIKQAIPGARVTVCQLRAQDETLIERVRMREKGARRKWYEKRSHELSGTLAKSAPSDFTVDTEQRSIPDIAEEIFRRVQWVENS